MDMNFKISFKGQLINILIDSIEESDIVDDTLTIEIPSKVYDTEVVELGDANTCFISGTKKLFDSSYHIPIFKYLEFKIPSTVSKIINFDVDNRILFAGKVQKELKVIIPNTIYELSTLAFQNLPFAEFSFEKNSKINILPKNCFYTSTFESKFIIPESCIAIESSCFGYVDFKQGIEINNSNLMVIEKYAFIEATINVDNLVFPSSIATIDTNSFKKTKNLKKISIPNNSGLIKIDASAFYNCENLAEVEIGSNHDDVVLGRNCFENCFNLKTLNIANISSEIIPEHFCYNSGNKNEVKISLPKNITQINTKAFFNTCLKSITIPATVTTIGNQAFYNSGLEKVVFENVENLSHLGSFSFFSNELKEIPQNILSNISYCGNNVFANNSFSDLKLLPPKHGVNLQEMFYKNLKLEKVELINSSSQTWKEIDDGLFGNCHNLITFIAPDSIRKIGTAAFLSTSILKIDLPNIEQVGACAFQDCEKLESCIFLNTKNLTLHDSAFSKSKSLKTIILPSYSTFEINKKAFTRWTKERVKKLFINSPFVEIV